MLTLHSLYQALFLRPSMHLNEKAKLGYGTRCELSLQGYGLESSNSLAVISAGDCGDADVEVVEIVSAINTNADMTSPGRCCRVARPCQLSFVHNRSSCAAVRLRGIRVQCNGSDGAFGDRGAWVQVAVTNHLRINLALNFSRCEDWKCCSFARGTGYPLE